MKYLLPIIGLLLLTGCSAQAEKNTLPIYVVNAPKVLEIDTQLRDCMTEVVDTPYYNIDRLRSGVQACQDVAFHRLQFKTNPESFYVYPSKNNLSPFDDFDDCTFGLSDPMWDFPPEETRETFSKTIRDCIATFPSKL